MTFQPPAGANVAVESLLDSRLLAIETSFDADVLAIYGPLLFGVDDVVRDVVETIKKKEGTPREHLTVLVDTDGGYLDVVARIVDTIRYHYRIVSFVVPNAAYSAGTVLVMSGDAIFMDYYSRLGPIDPQVQDNKGQMIPALGYLRQYEALIAKAASPAGVSLAEIQIILAFDQAQLYMYDQARERSVALLTDWLCQYKFKDWDIKETSRVPVTPEIRKARAKEVADKLNEHERWHSHSTGISATVLWDEMKLKTDPFGTHEQSIRDYHGLLRNYMELNGVGGVVHAVGMYRPYF